MPRLSPDDLCDAIVKQTANKRWLFNAKSEEWKRVLIRTGEKKKTITRGFARHVDHCPLNVRDMKGKPYANFIDDCSACEFLLAVGGNNDFIICGGRQKIRTFDELRFPRERGKGDVLLFRKTRTSPFPVRFSAFPRYRNATEGVPSSGA